VIFVLVAMGRIFSVLSRNPPAIALLNKGSAVDLIRHMRFRFNLTKTICQPPSTWPAYVVACSFGAH
jgi:hypothetical protein